jgi:hypothetical protein
MNFSPKRVIKSLRALDQIGESIFYQDGNYLVITLQVAQVCGIEKIIAWFLICPPPAFDLLFQGFEFRTGRNIQGLYDFFHFFMNEFPDFLFAFSTELSISFSKLDLSFWATSPRLTRSSTMTSTFSFVKAKAPTPASNIFLIKSDIATLLNFD